MRVANAKELFEKMSEQETADETRRVRVLQDTGRYRAYHEGYQWEAAAGRTWARVDTNGRLVANYNPDSGIVRVTDNIVTSMVIRKRAETHMAALSVDCLPPHRRADAQSAFAAQVAEDAINSAIDSSAYLHAARNANNARPIYGSYIIGLALEVSSRTVDMDGEAMTLPDRRVRAFTDAPHKLVLDPYQTSGNLHLHDWIGYRDVWTYAKAARVFGERFTKKVKESECLEIQTLAVEETRLAAATEGRLYGSYWKFSRSKGVVIRQWHCRDDSGRFGHMYIVADGMYESPRGESKLWVNEDDPTSPFGGDGLPLELIHAHQRDDSPVSIGDVQLVIDGQNRINLNRTTYARQQLTFAGSRPLIDLRSVGADNKEKAQQLWDNRIGAPLFYRSDKFAGIEKPDVLQFQPPSVSLLDAVDREYAQAMEKVSRPPVSTGEVKTHVSNQSQLTALAQADMPGNVRVSNDLEMHQRLLTTMLGTTILSIRAQSPGTLADMSRLGFGGREFSALAQMDPHNPEVLIKVNPSSVRMQAHEQRRADVFIAVESQMIGGMDARMILARDLDTPISGDDKQFARAADSAALDIVNGMEWQPIPVGEYGEVYIKAFRRSLAEVMDQAAKDRLSRAIAGQQQMVTQEAIQSDPAMVAQAAGAAQAQQGGAAPASPEATGAPVAISDALAAMAA